MSKQAVLLIAHGSPERVEDIPAFLQNISRGRPMSDAVVREVQHRYAQIGVSPVLTAAANASGGVMGKMIDAQSIVVASVATGRDGNETSPGAILRYVFLHSLALACLVGVLVLLQAYVFPWMIPTVVTSGKP